MSKTRKDEVLAKKEQKMYMMIKSVWFVFYSGKIECSDKREYIFKPKLHKLSVFSDQAREVIE